MTATIHNRPPTVTVDVHDSYVTPTGTSVCEQLTTDATGERPKWVTYDPASIQAIAFLRVANNTTRYSLGCAGYTHLLNVDGSELWTRPTHLDPAHHLNRESS